MDIMEEQKGVVVFTEQEVFQNQKTIQMIMVNFQTQHPEIISVANGDLTTLIREEKLIYSNLAIKYSVEFLMAMKKKSES